MGNFLSGQRGVVAQQQHGEPLAMPDGLDPTLLPYWETVAALLPKGVAAKHDTQIVLQLCQALHVRDRAYEQILSGGIEVADAAHGGEPRRNPAIITWRQAADMATGLMNLLGLSPISRARIQSADGEKADPLSEFIRRRHASDSE